MWLRQVQDERNSWRRIVPPGTVSVSLEFELLIAEDGLDSFIQHLKAGAQ